jgi:hypothetical protein
MLRAMSLTFVVCLALFAEAQEPNPLWDSVLTNCSGTYRLTVTAREDYTTLDITYNGESGKSIAIAHYKGERGFLYAWPISVIPNAVVGVWECGTGICTTAFPLTPKATEPVFNEWSESAPEFIWTDAGQVMLFYSGKHYLSPPSGLWEPRQAALYLWTGNRYKLSATVPYEQRFTALAKMRRTAVPQGAQSPCHN